MYKIQHKIIFLYVLNIKIMNILILFYVVFYTFNNII